MRNPTLLILLVLPVLGPTPAAAELLAPTVEEVQALWDSGARDSALTLAAAGTKNARASSDSLQLANRLLFEGFYRFSFRDYSGSEILFGEQVAISEALPDSSLLIKGVRWLGRSVGRQGRDGEAEKLDDRLLELSVLQGDLRHEGWARTSRGWRFWKRGNPEGALAEYDRASECFSGTEDVEGQIWALNAIAKVQTNQGEYDAAMAGYRASLARARETGRHNAESDALNDLGTVEYSLGLSDRALEHFRQAAALGDERGSPRQRIIPRFNIAICLNNLGRAEEARGTLEATLKTCVEQDPDLVAAALVKLGETLTIIGRHNEAIDHLRRVFAKGTKPRDVDRLNARIALAEALSREERLAEAETELMLARKLLATTNRTWQRLRTEGKLGVLLRRQDRHREALDRSLFVAGEAREHGIIEFQFHALAEAARSCAALALPDSALLLYEEAASTWESERRLLLDPNWRERRGSTGQRIFTDLATLLIEQGETAAAFDRIQSFKGRTLAERMFGPGSRHDRYLAADSVTVDLARLQTEILAGNETFLDFHLGPNRSLLFTASHEGLKVRLLPPRKELEGRLRAYAELLASPDSADRGTITMVGDRLARLLFGDALEQLGDAGRILVSPDGALNLLPFSELPGCEERLWTRVPSAGILARIRAERGDAPMRGAWRTLALASETGPGNIPLAGALREVEALDRRYRHVRARRLDRDDGGFEAGDLAGHDILHLAAHASRNDQSPWQSSIQFRPDDEAGVLRAAEIAELRLDAGLAVLSSCGSGGGKILSGEGVLGLSSAFLSAGVPAVVATLWAVDDAATANLMEAFYAGLADGEPCDRALAAAQAKLAADPATAHPYYWAGFVLIGERRLAPKLERRISPLLPALGLSLLLILVWTGRRKRPST